MKRLIQNCKSHLTPSFIFNILFFVNFLLLIIFFVCDFITVYYSKHTNQFVYNDNLRIFLEALVLKFFGAINISLVILIFISFRNKMYEFKMSKLTIFFILCFIFITLLNGGDIRPMFFFGIIFTIFIYDFSIQFNRYYVFHEKTFNILIYLLVAYMIAPLIIFTANYIVSNSCYFDVDYFIQLYTYDSFRGFTLDRIQFSYLAGLLFLMLYLQNSIKYKYIILLMLLIGLFLAQSRASIVALFISLIFLYRGNIKNSLLISFGILMFSIFWYIYAARVDLIGDPGDRIGIIYSSISTIFLNDILTLLFGSGNLYTMANNGVQPHNSILQTMLDFGIVQIF